MKPLDAILHTIRTWEGETFTEDPNDPGKGTKFGISSVYHPDVDVKALTEDQAVQIYLEEYWGTLPLIETYPDAAQWQLFDIAVNMGRPRASLWAGMIAPIPPARQAEALRKLRILHYADRVHSNPALVEYLRGWIRRAYDTFPEVD